MNDQADRAVLTILTRAELDGRDLDTELIWQLLRAAYSTGYCDAHGDPEPFPLTRAAAYRTETWARLPTS